jgi:hypothetical protein
MEKEFIPYTEALELKELGFDEICPTKYGMTSLKLYKDWKPYKNSDDIYEGKFYCNDLCAAPLYSQAFRWFREKYNMVGQVNVCTYFIYDMSNNDGFHTTLKMIKQYDRLCNNYEESEFECLKKLIEIIQTNS